MSKYFIELGGAISQFFNVLLLGGEANYSISTRYSLCTTIRAITTTYK